MSLKLVSRLYWISKADDMKCITDRFRTYWIPKLRSFSIPIACGSRKSFRDRYRMMLIVKRRWYSILQLSYMQYSLDGVGRFLIARCDSISPPIIARWYSISLQYLQRTCRYPNISILWVHSGVPLRRSGFPRVAQSACKTVGGPTRYVWWDPARHDGIPQGVRVSRQAVGGPGR